MKLRLSVVLCLLAIAAACGSKGAPATPTQPTPTPTVPTTPATTPVALVSPVSDAQLGTLRPTLTVTTPAATLAGRTYEFQIADQKDFAVGGGSKSAYYTVNVTKTGVGEGAGSTTYAVEQDLQPATRFYWRARWTNGTATSDWSDSGTFRTQIVGYNQPGEVYDPLSNGSTISDFRFKQTTFISGKGLRVDNSDSYVRYGMKQVISNGEMSMDVEGLTAFPVSDNPDTAKLKVFSMCDRTTDINFSKWMMNIQYRGFNGNPPNAISFKMLFGTDEDDHKLEPDLGTRQAGVRILNPSNTYYWKATWGGGFHLTVLDGGAGGVNGSGSAIGGSQVYDFGLSTPFVYAPPEAYAYLGTNNAGSETGSWPSAIYRNVWIANKPRPASLGSAMTPLK